MRQLLELMPKMLQQNPFTLLESDVMPQPHPLQCPYPLNVACTPSKRYRTYDGRCNNLLRPLWGAAHQPLARFLPPDYADGMPKTKYFESLGPLKRRHGSRGRQGQTPRRILDCRGGNFSALQVFNTKIKFRRRLYLLFSIGCGTFYRYSLLFCVKWI